MKTRDLQQFKDKSTPELHKNLADFRERLRKLKFDLSQGKVKNIAEIKDIKKNIARMLTILNKRSE